MTELTITKANIVTFPADVIVNAANSSLLGGGGVDGAIHRAAGKELLAECRKLHGAKTGEAKITGAHGITSAKYIVHTVGPVYKGLGPEKSAPLLAACYRNSLDVATTKPDVRSIAFSAISTGIYGYPLKDATEIARDTIQAWLAEHADTQLETITLLAFTDEEYVTMAEALTGAPPAPAAATDATANDTAAA